MSRHTQLLQSQRPIQPSASSDSKKEEPPLLLLLVLNDVPSDGPGATTAEKGVASSECNSKNNALQLRIETEIGVCERKWSFLLQRRYCQKPYILKNPLRCSGCRKDCLPQSQMNAAAVTNNSVVA